MRISLTVIALVTMLSVAGQPKDTTKSATEILKEKFEQSRKAIDKNNQLNPDSSISHLQQLSNEQFTTSMMIERQKQKSVAYDNFLLTHAQRSFRFQYITSILIFGVVILIVVAGLVFSGYQFRLTMKQLELKDKLMGQQMRKALKAQTPGQPAAPAPPEKETLANLKNEVELSMTGVKVNSSVLGVIILALSIAFFYLYLTIVYPIRYVGPEAPGVEKTEKKDR